MKLKILLLGNTGQLGWELNRSLLTLGEITGLDFPQIDLTAPESIRSIIHEVRPNLIINATAFTAVDQAEVKPELAMAINGTGPGIIAEEAAKLNAAVIHYSTDYVFDGKKGSTFVEEDNPSPINVYGESKLAGESAVQAVDGVYWIFRTSWVYSLRRPCFVTKVLKWARDHEILRIVDDQISSPTWARTLADATAQILAKHQGNPLDFIREKKGLYHLTDRGSCSRFEWAQSILALDTNKEEQIVKDIQRAKSNEFPNPAERPQTSILDCEKIEKTFNLHLPYWKTSLTLAFDQGVSNNG